MTRRLVIPVFAALLAAGSLFADFSYEETSKMTGGVLASAMKVVGVFSRQANQPIHTSVLLKGDRMAHVSAESIQVIDLGAETITDINLKNKTYSALTFAQMAQYMDQLSKKAAAQNEGKGELKIKASVKETGQTKQISGLNTREVILTLVMEGTDKESGQKGGLTLTADQWLAKDVPGYGEVRAFYQRMAQKLSWMPGSNPMLQGRSDMAKAMADLKTESAKMEGVPVMQVISMGGQAEGQPGEQQNAKPAQKQESESPSIGGALGRLGGLGGLGRRKKEEPPKEEKPATAPGTLLEITSESTNFSTASVDASKFQVPAGFKKVESPMAKGLQ